MEAVGWPPHWPCLQDPWLDLLSSLPTPPLALALAGSWVCNTRKELSVHWWVVTTEQQGGRPGGTRVEHQLRSGQCLGAMVSMVTMTASLRRVAAHGQFLWWLLGRGAHLGAGVTVTFRWTDLPSEPPLRLCLGLSAVIWLGTAGMGSGGLLPWGHHHSGDDSGLGTGPFPSLGTDSHSLARPPHPWPGRPSCLGVGGASGGATWSQGGSIAEPRLPSGIN